MRPTVVGVAGGSGSGKTTVVERLVERLGPAAATVLPHDRYYRDLSDVPAAQRARMNFDHPDALETSLLIEHVRQLRRGSPVALPVYDFARHARTPDIELVAPRPTLIVEGILVLTDGRLRRLMDIKVFVHTAPPIRLERRMKRDMAERGRSAESVLEQYGATVQPMHDAYVEPTRAYADLVIEEGGFNDAALDRLLELIRQRQ